MSDDVVDLSEALDPDSVPLCPLCDQPVFEYGREYNDPTYATLIIQNNPVWRAAFMLSEIYNTNAPLGWGDYISTAEKMQHIFDQKAGEDER